ncbi:MAG TPA: NAD(P)H-dependent oxidoreductase [Sphingomonas sp.]|nr:NAD(P)H-dependent oxidoreductase [Sphingomonas sp.]
MGDTHPEPIRHLVVLGHPVAGSFNHSVAETYCQTVRECGQAAELRDLYAIGFDPLLTASEWSGEAAFPPAVLAERELLSSAAIVTLVYPIWFGLPPAIVKGYVDRALGAGFDLRGLREGGAQPALADKRLMQFSSSATTLPWLEEQGQWVSLRQTFGRYLSTVFGMKLAEHVHFDAVVHDLSARVVDEHLERVRAATRQICATMLSERHAAHGSLSGATQS